MRLLSAERTALNADNQLIVIAEERLMALQQYKSVRIGDSAA